MIRAEEELIDVSFTIAGISEDISIQQVYS
jgi:hypothetical protein